MTEAALLGTLGFVFVGIGLVAVAVAFFGLLGAGITCIVVGIALGCISTL